MRKAAVAELLNVLEQRGVISKVDADLRPAGQGRPADYYAADRLLDATLTWAERG